MAAIEQAMVSKILNALLPTGAAGIPGTMITALSGAAMKLRANSGTSTPSAAGTEITGSGYVAGGTAFSVASTASSAGSAVTCPKTTAITWTNASGGNWSFQSLDITDGAGLRVWFGNWNGAPVVVANGNSFQVAADAISVSLT